MILERRSVFGWPATAAAKATPRNGVVVHFDGSNQGLAGKPHSACRRYWRNTRIFHMGPQRGWKDIGYSFAVCPHSIAMEGRGLDREQAAQPGGNRTWYSCTFMSGPAESPTVDQLEAFADLRGWLRTKGVAAAIKGHRQFVSTDCPGPLLFTLVRNGTLAAGGSADSWTEKLVKKLPTVGPGDTGEAVETVQGLLIARSHPEVKVTGRFDAVTERAVRALQEWGRVAVDGTVGPNTWPVLLRVHQAAA